MTDQMLLALIGLLAEDRDTIPYRRALATITGSVVSSLLLQQAVYWWKIQGYEPFYKFRTPCEHAFYKPGDSWCEELGIGRRAFENARKLIAIKKLQDENLNDVALTGRAMQPPHPLIYWITPNRITYYTFDAETLGKLLSICYGTKRTVATVLNVPQLRDETSHRRSETTQRLPENYAKAGTKKVYLEEGDLQFRCVRCEEPIELGKLPKRDSKCPECGQPYEVYEEGNPTPTWKPKRQKKAYPLHLVIPGLPEHLSSLDCRTRDISEGIATAWRFDPDMMLEKLEWAFNLQALSNAFGKHQICERARTAFTTSFQEKGTQHEPAPQSRSNVPLPAGEQDLGTESQNEHPHTTAEEWDPTSPW